MDKNTVWAIFLSLLVLIGFMFWQTATMEVPEVAVVQETVAETPVNSVVVSSPDVSSEVIEADIEPEETVAEEEIIISTEFADIRLTNRGGDIIGYELKNHRDGENGVEMAENITETNRALSISFGSAENPIINDLFSVEIIDDYTVGFSKQFTVDNSAGQAETFILKKLYAFDPEEYLFRLTVGIEGRGNMRSLSFGNVAYTLRSSPQMGPYYDPSADRYENRTFYFFDGKSQKKTLSAGNTDVYDKSFSWAGISGKYFAQQIVPIDASSVKDVVYSTKNEVDGFQDAQIMLERMPITQSSVQDTYYVYMGPKVDNTMVIYNNANDNNWGLHSLRIDEILSSGWLSWLETILKFLMEMFYKLIPNWGVSIILMTVLLKLVLYPLTKKSSMATLKMQELQPQIKELQEKYKDNKEKLNIEMAKFYKEAGYNPLSGCLPLLIQFPLIIAMYGLFSNYFEFRGAMFIEGWIPDLSVSDSVGVFPEGLWFVGGTTISLLPVIYVASQLLFTKVTQSTAASPSNSSMKYMMYLMPLIFFVMFYRAPSGLLLYWTVSNLLQLVQQVIINKMMHRKRNEMGLNTQQNEKKVLPPTAKAKKRKKI
ncbi:MAG: membrane protein insertase YidC [Spirochaetales bacterium]